VSWGSTSFRLTTRKPACSGAAARRRLLAQIKAGGPPGTREEAALPSLVQASAHVYEALRLYPPAFLIVRQAVAADIIIGHEVPAGTTVTISRWVIHRHRARWRRSVMPICRLARGRGFGGGVVCADGGDIGFDAVAAAVPDYVIGGRGGGAAGL